MTIHAIGVTKSTTSTATEQTKKKDDVQINFSKDTDIKTQTIKQTKEDIINLILEMLDLEDNFLTPSIIEKDGKLYLQLSRDRADKDRPEQRNDFRMSAIKYNLRLHDNVIDDNNDIKYITESYSDKGLDNRTIEQGYSMIIPLEALGQNQKWFDIFTTEHDKLKDLVQKLQELVNKQNKI